MRKTEALTGEITLDVKEGDLLPETYFYSRDDTRDGLLLRMKEAMEKTLDEAWRKRARRPAAGQPARCSDAGVDRREGDRAFRPSAPGWPRCSSTGCGAA